MRLNLKRVGGVQPLVDVAFEQQQCRGVISHAVQEEHTVPDF